MKFCETFNICVAPTTHRAPTIFRLSSTTDRGPCRIASARCGGCPSPARGQGDSEGEAHHPGHGLRASQGTSLYSLKFVLRRARCFFFQSRQLPFCSFSDRVDHCSDLPRVQTFYFHVFLMFVEREISDN